MVRDGVSHNDKSDSLKGGRRGEKEMGNEVDKDDDD